MAGVSPTITAVLPETIVKFLSAWKQEEPIYLYDVQELRRQCRSFLDIPYRNKKIHFATMANCAPPFLRILREEGLGVFVNTLGHLEAVEAAGFTASDIVFTASASPPSLLVALGRKGIEVNLDSLQQIEAWRRIHAGKPFGIRCNIGDHVNPRRTTGGVFLGKTSRLGLTTEEVASLKGSPDVRGLHLYVGTNIMDVEYFRTCYRSFAELAGLFPSLEYLDVGGGFGIPEEEAIAAHRLDDIRGFDFAVYGEMVSELFSSLSEKHGRPIRLVLEPGRIIGASSGFFLARVTDVKFRDGYQLIGVNASSAQFPRPLFYPEDARHPVFLFAEGEIKTEGRIPTKVYGCSTYSRDYLSRDAQLPPARIGDAVVWGYAGAYCNSAFTEFLGFACPHEFYLEGE